MAQNMVRRIKKGLILFSKEICDRCLGRTYHRESETVCVTCGSIKYHELETLADIKRPRNLSEWVNVDGLGSFKVHYVVKNRSLMSETSPKGTPGKQPYASCKEIEGPRTDLPSQRSAQTLCKGFYRATGLKLKNVPVKSKRKSRISFKRAS